MANGAASLWSGFLGYGGQQLSALVGGRPRPRPTLCPNVVTIDAKARTRREDRTARHVRVRKKVEGTPDRPRLCVFRSNKHLYVQVIDDTKMHTLASASTMQKPISEGLDYSSGPTLVSLEIRVLLAKCLMVRTVHKLFNAHCLHLYSFETCALL
uniref:50S ribosomal protein L18ic n=1 Tax=Rhizophora mucronata TaxID=61149 RepID=A0A2P2IS89_RHIMU